MRILHTSDWHLGAQLHEQSRIAEQIAFLEWLKGLMRKEQPDALIIAGDIFDSCAPSNTAQNIYYDFLSATFKDGLCRDVVVVGGNHDSPSLLDAPGTVLTHLRTHVVGAVAYLEDGKGGYLPDYEKEVVIINDGTGTPALIIGAVPYLRDADLRTSEAMETDVDRSDKLKRGFKEHYSNIAGIAHRKGIGKDGVPLPVILTGHLFLTGATMAEEKSERDLHIGNLGALDFALLPKADYYALGHLHTSQKVGGVEICRYSGAPIPLSFGEITQTKSVTIVDFSSDKPPAVRLESIPQTQKLSQLNGTPEDILAKLNELVATRESIWVDIQVTEGVGDLSTWWSTYSTTVEGSGVRLLRWQNARGGKNGSALAVAINEDATLDNLTPEQLFKMRLTDEDLAVDDQAVYSAMFAEISQKFAEADTKKD